MSLSAKILMKLRILDVIIVQCPELALKYPQTRYIEKNLLNERLQIRRAFGVFE